MTHDTYTQWTPIANKHGDGYEVFLITDYRGTVLVELIGDGRVYTMPYKQTYVTGTLICGDSDADFPEIKLDEDGMSWLRNPEVLEFVEQLEKLWDDEER